MPATRGTASAKPRTPQTSHGLLADARHAVLPAGIVSSGFPAVQRTCAAIGLLFDEWQVDLNRCILAKDAHGLYAADTVVISIPRQVGKTYDIGGLVFADCIINPGTTTVWTAHRFKVSRETFDSLRALAKSPLLAPHIDYEAITTAAGNECIPFRNGSRIVFAARERGAIRGFTKVRRLVLDEAQILTESALSDMVPTMNQAENPQIILMGTPPKPNDPGEVFTNLRREALDGDSEGVLYVEFSAPKDSDPGDRATWRAANPSYPRRTPTKAILRLKKLLSPDDFRREGLGIWDSDTRKTAWTVIRDQAWLARAVSAAPDGKLAYGVDMAPDRSWLAIGVAVKPESGPAHVEAVRHEPTTLGTAWAVDWLAERWPDSAAVVIDQYSNAMSLVPELRARHVKVTVTDSREMARACGLFVDAVRDEALTHFGQKPLDDALAGATKRDIGMAGGWGWNRKTPAVDITPLVAVTLALYGVMTSKRVPGRKSKAVVLQ